eukprot:RCo042891
MTPPTDFGMPAVQNTALHGRVSMGLGMEHSSEEQREKVCVRARCECPPQPKKEDINKFKTEGVTEAREWDEKPKMQKRHAEYLCKMSRSREQLGKAGWQEGSCGKGHDKEKVLCEISWTVLTWG